MIWRHSRILFFFFFFNDTATTEIYTLSLHDALPICPGACGAARRRARSTRRPDEARALSPSRDRKSTRLNSSHSQISYAVFCLKKKKIITAIIILLPPDNRTPVPPYRSLRTRVTQPY